MFPSKESLFGSKGFGGVPPMKYEEEFVKRIVRTVKNRTCSAREASRLIGFKHVFI